jgi:diaminopimelate epimerase
MEQNFFVKAHGLGNDYLVLDEDFLTIDLTKEAIKRICSVHFGIGSDGILLKTQARKADFGLKILNPDGSEAEKSGNGLRIFSKFLFDWGYTKKEEFQIETPGGLVRSRVTAKKQNRASLISVDMGRATFKPDKIPVLSDKSECLDEILQLKNKTYTINCVSVGNPHCVIVKDKLNIKEIKKFGPEIESHKKFPNRINVQFVKPVNKNLVEILIWERGAGYTLASGSSSCAVGAVMYKKGITNGNMTVNMQGGALKLSIDNKFNINMTGEVEEIAHGILSDELLARFPKSATP